MVVFWLKGVMVGRKVEVALVAASTSKLSKCNHSTAFLALFVPFNWLLRNFEKVYFAFLLKNY